MRRLFLLISCFSIIHFSAAQTDLAYQIKVDTSSPQSQIIVKLCFKAPKATQTTLQLPSSFGSQEQLYKAIKYIKKIQPVAVLLTQQPTTDSLVITHSPSEQIEIEYALQQDWQGSLVYPKNYRAIIQKDHIHLTSNALYIFPKYLLDKKITVSLDWQGLPKNWQLAHSLTCQKRVSKHTLSSKDFLNTLYVAGDFRVLQAKIKGKPIFVAIRGKNWKFTDQAFLEMLQKILTAERNFWNDHKEPHYLVTVVPFEDEGSLNGSALHQSFMFGMSQEFPLDIYVKSLLAHEYCHRWIGVEGIQMKSINQENAWFTEGFTEYYTYKILWKSNLITQTEYIQKVNEAITGYFLSPVINAHKDTLGNNFWKGRDYQLFPYKKGFVYALYLEQLIQKKTNYQKSLDELMQALIQKAKKKEYIEEQDFIQTVNEIISGDIRKLHTEWIVEGKTIPVEPKSLQGIRDELKEIGVFDAGFDVEKSFKSYVITGVNENSAAWKAGLRNNQKIKSISLQYDQIHIPVKITIENEDKTLKNIEYLPMSQEKKTLRQFIP